MGTTDCCREPATNRVTGACIYKSVSKCKSTCIEDQHFPRDLSQSLFLIHNSEHRHQDTACKGDPPGCDVELCGENQTDHGYDKDHHTNFINHRRQFAGNILLFFCCRKFNCRLARTHFRSDRHSPYQAENDNRKSCKEEIERSKFQSGKLVSFQITVELTGFLDGGRKRKCETAGNHDNH